MKFIPLIFILILSMPSYAGNLGLGISVKNNENTIFVPYSLTDTIFIEGGFVYSEIDIASSNQDRDAYEIGIGLFKKFNIQNKLFAYYGGRVNYINVKSDSIITSSFGRLGYRSESEQDGYRISPTVGAAYELLDSFSVAAEIEYSYSDMDIESQVINYTTGVSTGTGDRNSIKQSGTNTRFVIRYMF